MLAALEYARAASSAGEVPIGAVAVRNGEIIAGAGNAVERCCDATCHAEMEVLRHCAARRGDWRMEEIDIFVTKEPCAMCAGAMVNARVRRVVFGLPDQRSGACGSALDVTGFPGMLWQVESVGGVLAGESHDLIRQFFRQVRNGEKAKPPSVAAEDQDTFATR